uniref:Non-SMC condensin II complex, subunit G2 n=1 Tax=Amphiprion percula TaxID=161767 RepID=A0A3P8TFG6_AMPPE
MSKREAFLEAVCKENVEDFLRFIQRHKDKTEPFDVEEVVQEMARDQREAMWGRLASLLQDILLELPPERWEEGGDEGMQEQSAKHVMAVVDGVTLVSTVSLKALEDGDAYSALLETVRRLNDVLESLPVSEAPLQHHIHALCEAWWKKGLQEREKFGRTAFLMSLQKSFTLKKPVSISPQLCRVWSLHDVLLSLDYTSEDNKPIINLLLQCFQHPTYIRNDDGKRFLVFLFSWNVDFIWIIHATIKNQLQFYSKTITTHIAEMYFRAWKKAGGDFLENIESSCIQDFMQNAIFLRRASPVHAKVRQIVSYFHTRSGCKSVDKMLYNLYRPILWKALSAPNFEVRANATLLFTEAFPIHDPDQSNENIDENIQKQLDTGLLDDPHPTVRSNAILGVCKILAKCWELLPPTIITDFLKKLMMELASDTSSADVRCSVFKCLTIVLDNPLSHPVLEKLLPTLKYSLHDNSEKVRTAFLDMLIKVKAVRAAKFWDVCNMDHLLARLALDSPSVSKRIVDLLFKSFFPVNESEKEWCCRCITLIQMNPMAARKFYQYAHKHTAPTNIIKLMFAIRRVLNGCIQVDCDQTDINDSNKENSMAAPALLGKDMAVASSLLEVVVILWRSVEKALKQNDEAQKYTYAKFGSVMAKYFQDERCTVPLIHLASFMPSASVPTFSCGVLSRLRKMDSGASSAQYGQLLDCICSWGQAADVLELITDWLTESLPKQADKATVSRKVRIQETVEVKPELALAYMEYLFSHASTREKVLALGDKPLKQLHTVLGNWKVHLNRDPRTYILLIHIYSCFHILTFSLKVVLWPHAALPELDPLQKLYSFVFSEAGYLCIPAVLPFLKEVANSYVPEDNNKDQENQEDAVTVILGVVANIFQKIIELLARCLRKDPEEGKQVTSTFFMSNFVDLFFSFRAITDMTALSLAAAVLVFLKITHPEEVITPESVEDMPTLSCILLSVILKSPSTTRSFLAEVTSSLDSEAINSLIEVAAVLHVLTVIKHGEFSSPEYPFLDKFEDLEQVIYESSVMTLNAILQI